MKLDTAQDLKQLLEDALPPEWMLYHTRAGEWCVRIVDETTPPPKFATPIAALLAAQKARKTG